jgi:hypothetical protein
MYFNMYRKLETSDAFPQYLEAGLKYEATIIWVKLGWQRSNLYEPQVL